MLRLFRLFINGTLPIYTLKELKSGYLRVTAVTAGYCRLLGPGNRLLGPGNRLLGPGNRLLGPGNPVTSGNEG